MTDWYDASLEDEVDALAAILERRWVGAYIAAHPSTGTFDIPWPEAARYARERAGWLIREMEGVSAQRVQQILREQLEHVFDPPYMTEKDLAQLLMDSFDQMSEWRAETIIRTEIAWATGLAASSAWRSADVQYVAISDGQDFDAECQEVDGTTVPIEWYEANIIEHPNCTRAASPVGIGDFDPADLFEPY